MKGISLFTLRLICLLLVTAAGTFTLLSFSPVDPIRAYIGSDLLHVPPEQYPLIAARWGAGFTFVATFFALVYSSAPRGFWLLDAV